MFKLVVLLVAVSVAQPGYSGDSYGSGNGYGYGGLGYGYEHGGYVSIPSAVSHQSQVSIHSKPIVAAVATAPVIVKPTLYLPAATSHQSRVDYVNKPFAYTKSVVSYGTPALAYGNSYVASSPISSGLYENSYNGITGYGLGYGNGNGLGYEQNYYGFHY